MVDWIENEMAGQNMGDTRLNKRMAKLLATQSVEPSRSLPCANETWKETLASYRLFDNKRANFDSIMSGHRAATHERIQCEPVVLIPQDTTYLNFATDDKSKQMGTLRTKNSNQ